MADPTDWERRARYWEIRARFLLIETARLEATIETMKREGALAETMRQAGLNPAGNYLLDDATATITLADGRPKADSTP